MTEKTTLTNIRLPQELRERIALHKVRHGESLQVIAVKALTAYFDAHDARQTEEEARDW